MYFKRDIKSLSAVFGFLNGFYQKHGLKEDISFALNLAVEEIFTNLVKYHQGNPNRIRIELKKEGDKVAAVISDFDVPPFDPTRAQKNVHALPLKERPLGGLGLNLVKKMVDEFKYDYNKQTKECSITLIKYLGENHV